MSCVIPSAEVVVVAIESSSLAYSVRPFLSNVDSEVSCSGPASKFLEWTLPPSMVVKLFASTLLCSLSALNSLTSRVPPILASPVTSREPLLILLVTSRLPADTFPAKLPLPAVTAPAPALRLVPVIAPPLMLPP